MITKRSNVWRYFSHVFISIDQFGNALAGGNADNTISARVGFYNHHYPFENNKVPWYWSYFEKIIDLTFLPVDGPNHCHEAYHNDAGEIFDNRLTNVMVGFASIIIILSCVVIGPILDVLTFVRLVKCKTISRHKNLGKRLDSCSLVLSSAAQELEEHDLDFDPNSAKEQRKALLLKVDELEKVIQKIHGTLT